MSESQKMFASLSGAFIAHLLLFVAVIFVPRTDSEGSSATREDKPKAQEVTIDMGDLMERLERERVAEPAPPEPPAPATRPFISTDLNPPEAAAPENARFESDRNTSAASRLRPDTNLPMADVPTLEGDSRMTQLTLADRQWVEGPLQENPGSAKGSPKSPTAPAPPLGPPPTAPALPEPVARREGGGIGTEEAVSLNPGRKGEDLDGAGREKRFVHGAAGSLASTPLEASAAEDRLSMGSGSGKEGEGPPDPLASGTQEGVMTPAETPEETSDEMKSVAAPPPADATPQPADNGLFAEGFTPEARQNVINGSLARQGDNAVDAEGTPMGRYKKSVRDAISVTWHRYKQENADFVTWGILKLEFRVDPDGRVRDLRITKNEANAMLAEFSLRAIREADLPTMPDDVAKSVGPKGLAIQYDIIIY